jgi:hypothetical protein
MNIDYTVTTIIYALILICILCLLFLLIVILLRLHEIDKKINLLIEPKSKMYITNQ